MTTVESARLKLVSLPVEYMQFMLDDYQRLEIALGLPPTEQKLVRRLRPVISHSIHFSQQAPEYHIWYTYWVMILKAEQRIVGGLGFKGPANDWGEVEVGYGTDDAHRNQGYMTEAVTAMVRWALAQPGVRSVRAETANTNLPSMRVLQKVGFSLFRATDRFLYWRIQEAPAQQPAPPRQPATPDSSGQFELYDLAVVVEQICGNCTCDMKEGDKFYLRRSSSLTLPTGGHFCIWALNSILPFLAARQRQNHPADWIETDSRVSCPDPACGLTMRIDRIGVGALHHDEVSPIPWDSLKAGDPDTQE